MNALKDALDIHSQLTLFNSLQAIENFNDNNDYKDINKHTAKIFIEGIASGNITDVRLVKWASSEKLWEFMYGPAPFHICHNER